MNKYKVITLCGSTRFKEDFERVNRELTLQGILLFLLVVLVIAGINLPRIKK